MHARGAAGVVLCNKLACFSVCSMLDLNSVIIMTPVSSNAGSAYRR
jgi:hypothetical protein